MARTPTTHEGRLTHTIRLMSVKYAVDGSKATLQFTVIYVSVKVHAYSHTSRGVSFIAPVSAVARLRTLYNWSRTICISDGDSTPPTGAALRARARARRVAVGRGVRGARFSAHSMRGSGRQKRLEGTLPLASSRQLDVARISERGLRPPDELNKVHSLLLCVQARTVIVVFDRSPCAASTTIPI